MTIDCDVVVVGAGPAGSATAALLARRGYRVTLADRARFPRPKACAEYLSPGVHDVLQRIGLHEALTHADMFPVTGMEIVAPHGARMRIHYKCEGAPVFAHTIPREHFDNALVQAAEREGANLVEGFIARQPCWEGGAVRGVSGSFSGSQTEIRARLTIVADGARSTLSAALGLSRRPRWPVRLGLVAHYDGPAPLRDGYGEMHVDRGGYCGVAPLSRSRLNVSVVVPSDALRSTRLSATAFFERWIASRPRLRELLADCRRTGPVRGLSPIGARAGQPWTPGALLTGDAAGFFDPFTGEGIHRALRGAELVSEVAVGALETGDVSETGLAAYSGMREEAFRSKHAVSALMQTFVRFPVIFDYTLPRLGHRPWAQDPLAAVLGDLADPWEFLNPRNLWATFRP